jgi:hypothetical protein
VALAVALHVAIQEEREYEAGAETREQNLELRLARIEAQLADLDATFKAWSPGQVSGFLGRKPDDQ